VTDEDLNKRFDGLGTRFTEAMGGLELRSTERIGALELRFTGAMSALETRFTEAMGALEARLVEAMRDMQTELLRGFEAFAASQTIRLRKVEADQSNLDAALSARVDVLERRLLQIEQRLGGAK
jgi:hypothetical protein